MSFDLKLVNGDLSFDSQGRIELVRDTNKLTQDVLKIIDTTRGSDVFDQNYGVSITSMTVGRVITNSTIPAQVQAEIQTQLQKLQREQTALATYQVLSPQERIQQIDKVSVERDATELRQLNITIELTTLSNTPITIQQTISL